MNLVDKSLKINFANESLVKENERERERRRQMVMFASQPYLNSSQAVYREPGHCSPDHSLFSYNESPNSMTYKPSNPVKKFFKDPIGQMSSPFANKQTQFSLFGTNPVLDDF